MNNKYTIKDFKMEGVTLQASGDGDYKGELLIEKLEVGELELTFEDIANIIRLLKKSN